jgi:hypothetical protein
MASSLKTFILACLPLHPKRERERERDFRGCYMQKLFSNAASTKSIINFYFFFLKRERERERDFRGCYMQKLFSNAASTKSIINFYFFKKKKKKKKKKKLKNTS